MNDAYYNQDPATLAAINDLAIQNEEEKAMLEVIKKCYEHYFSVQKYDGSVFKGTYEGLAMAIMEEWRLQCSLLKPLNIKSHE